MSGDAQVEMVVTCSMNGIIEMDLRVYNMGSGDWEEESQKTAELMVGLLQTRGVKEYPQETPTTTRISSFPGLAALARSSRAHPAEQETFVLKEILVHSFFLSFFLSFLPSIIIDPIQQLSAFVVCQRH